MFGQGDKKKDIRDVCLLSNNFSVVKMFKFQGTMLARTAVVGNRFTSISTSDGGDETTNVTSFMQKSHTLYQSNVIASIFGNVLISGKCIALCLLLQTRQAGSLKKKKFSFFVE